MEKITINDIIEDEVLRTRISNIIISAVCDNEVDITDKAAVVSIITDIIDKIKLAIKGYYDELNIEVEAEITAEELLQLA